MTEHAALRPMLEAIYDLCLLVCQKIDDFAPDVVLGLAHSGWMPVAVARSVQGAVGLAAFPPAVRTNIGQEKHDVYIKRYGSAFPAFCCGECSDEPLRAGHYLAWLSTRARWLDELREQVRETLGEGQPRRILVVDDVYGGLRTAYTALGLLDALYPGAESVMIAGYADLTNDFVDAWIETFAPGILETVPKTSAGRSNRYGHNLHEKLKPLITGSEDINPASLRWKPISVESDAVQRALHYADIETVLEAPAWAERTAGRYVHDRLRGHIQDEDAVKAEDQRTFPITEIMISPEERAERDSWLKRGYDLFKGRPHNPTMDEHDAYYTPE